MCLQAHLRCSLLTASIHEQKLKVPEKTNIIKNQLTVIIGLPFPSDIIVHPSKHII
jgi:hypothetical protein